MWPNSCATTQANKSTMNRTPSSAAACPPTRQCVPAIQTRKSRKVTWMRTTVPAITAMGMDQSMENSAEAGRARPAVNVRRQAGVAAHPRDGASQRLLCRMEQPPLRGRGRVRGSAPGEGRALSGEGSWAPRPILRGLAPHPTLRGHPLPSGEGRRVPSPRARVGRGWLYGLLSPDFLVRRDFLVRDGLADPRHVHQVLVVQVLGDRIAAPGPAPQR